MGRRKDYLFTFSFISWMVFSPAQAEEWSKRPLDLIHQMAESPLKNKLLSCKDQTLEKTFFSIGHRGAPLKLPEHTRQSYEAALEMGAGLLECDVTFTKDKVLVCRHSQADLHYTTNILETPLAEKCSIPFQPASEDQSVKVQCLTSDLTLEEFKSLEGRMGDVNPKAASIREYLKNLWGTGEMLSHGESIALFEKQDVKFIPELKRPLVDMPFGGFSRQDYAQKLVDEYKQERIHPKNVFLQSFHLEDILYWLEHEPDFAKQAVFLDARFRDAGFDTMNPKTFTPSMKELKEKGLNYIAPPLWMLVQSKNGQIVASPYAREAKAAGLKIITWTIERSGSLKNGGGWYYQTINDLIENDGQVFEVLDVLAKDVGVEAVFSDWPATSTYYANCMGIH